MQQENIPIPTQPRWPVPRDDVDDLIFREENWLVSDR